MQSAPIIGVVTCLYASCLSQMRGVKRRGRNSGGGEGASRPVYVYICVCVYICTRYTWPTLCERAGIQHRVTASAEFSGWKTRRVEFVCWLEECSRCVEGLDFERGKAIRALIRFLRSRVAPFSLRAALFVVIRGRKPRISFFLLPLLHLDQVGNNCFLLPLLSTRKG